MVFLLLCELIQSAILWSNKFDSTNSFARFHHNRLHDQNEIYLFLLSASTEHYEIGIRLAQAAIPV